MSISLSRYESLGPEKFIMSLSPKEVCDISVWADLSVFDWGGSTLTGYMIRHPNKIYEGVLNYQKK